MRLPCLQTNATMAPLRRNSGTPLQQTMEMLLGQRRDAVATDDGNAFGGNGGTPLQQTVEMFWGNDGDAVATDDGNVLM